MPLSPNTIQLSRPHILLFGQDVQDFRAGVTALGTEIDIFYQKCDSSLGGSA